MNGLGTLEMTAVITALSYIVKHAVGGEMPLKQNCSCFYIKQAI